jgi:uncharacterized coiled-coil DUF342 family protein
MKGYPKMASGVIQTPHVALSQYRTKLQQAANELEATVREMVKIASKLNEGGLVGRAGTAMSAALTERLNKAIQALQTQTLQVEQDVAKAIQQSNKDVEDGAARQITQ